jgi:hypothetical protein
MDKFLKALSVIMANPDLQQELAKKETIENVYDYCVSISDGYTIDEFKEFLYELFKTTDNIPEWQLEKISGGIKFNNKIFSTMLTAMVMASPLAKAESKKPNEPSVISVCVQKIKDEIENIASKHPVETAIVGGGAGVGALLLAAISAHRLSQNTNTPARTICSVGQFMTTQPPVQPLYLSDIDAQFSSNFEIVNLFKQTGVGNINAKELKELCERNCREQNWDFSSQIKNISSKINSGWASTVFPMQKFSFYRNYKEIPGGDFVRTDTSDIGQLHGLFIRGGDISLGFTDEQKAVIIRYCQTSWLHEKGIF